MTDEQQKKIEEMIGELVQDDDSLESLLRILNAMKGSGSLLLLESVITKNMPGSTAQIKRILDSQEIHSGGLKLLDVLIALMASLSQEPTADVINSILYNGDDIWSSMVQGAKKPDNYSLLRLMGLFKDPDLAAGLTAALNALKELGKILRGV